VRSPRGSYSLFALFLLIGTTVAAAPLPESSEAETIGRLAQRVVPSPLLAIDQNRKTVIERIVRQWGDALARTNAGIEAWPEASMDCAMRIGGDRA
jgi:hypothetical protein